MTIEEKALARTARATAKPGWYRPADKVLAVPRQRAIPGNFRWLCVAEQEPDAVGQRVRTLPWKAVKHLVEVGLV